ncbi:MAG TPA: YggS family pyridoxal phosphate-dependent enzyme [Gemmatimonas sp.]|uniref:YggS family pyridoxal phosphate-dependent enzyme n=1 Tax=Gemmatimonas sp. TaxID=1962908 RepID=UPI002ED8D94D
MPVSGHTAVAADQVRESVAEVRARIAAARSRGGHGQDVTLIAVTKTHGPDAVEAAYAAGVVDVGENKVQEAESKMAVVSAPVRWHLIGHLQRNKARNATRFDLVHSVDSERLAVALHEEATKAGRSLEVLLQVNVSGETSKGGVNRTDVPALAKRLHDLPGLRVRGVMTMAPFEAAEAELRTVFTGARIARAVLQEAGHPAEWLSMGMSGDYEIAVEEGATHVRLGTVLFGSRI